MMRFYLSIILIFLLVPELLGFQPDSLIKSGNNHYAKGAYNLAIKDYDQVIDSGYEAAELYFNIGNAWYKLNNITYAILNYERAKLLDPFDKDIRHNLALANAHVVDKIDIIPEFFLKRWIRYFTNLTTSNIWAICSVTAFILFLFFMAVFLFSSAPGLKKASFWLAVIVIIISLSSFYFSFRRMQILTLENRAVILAPTLTVKSSPDEEGKNLFILHEGTIVNVEDSINNWNRIKISDGNSGWVKKSDIVKI
jgi:tetratricopeptide (TPR) repeat protein